MKYDPNIHKRRSIRLKGFDYSQEGLYYITICVKNHQRYYGNIINGEMVLNEAGKMIEQEWLNLKTRFPNIELHEFVTMPNHFHGIIEIVGATLVVAPSQDLTPNAVVASSQDLSQNAEVAPSQELTQNAKFDPVHDITQNANVAPSQDLTQNANVAPMHDLTQNINHRNEDLIHIENINYGNFSSNNGNGQSKGLNLNEIDKHLGFESTDIGKSNGFEPSVIGQPQGIAPTNKTIGDMLDAFKSITTVEYIRGVKNLNWKPFNGKLWQRNYYEIIIRDETAFNNISNYIMNNPANWRKDKFNVNK